MKNLIIILILATGMMLISAKKDKKAVFTIKNIDRSLSKLGESTLEKIYASKYETSNFLYQTFLSDLENNNQVDKLEKAKIDTAKWGKAKGYKQPMQAYYHSHLAFENYPVVNISHEGATMFCEWLTEKYNATRERKFNKVIFRLPTKTEWEKAAAGGLKSVSYPWGGVHLINRKACCLCNYYDIGASSIHYNKEAKAYEVIPDAYASMDNTLTCKVDEYPPNDYGIHNMSGNVKEMIDQKGISKGGGYLSTGYDVRIQSEDTYKESTNDLGFRYFMEVIEE